MDCRRYGGSMNEMIRRRMMGSKERIVPLQYININSGGSKYYMTAPSIGYVQCKFMQTSNTQGRLITSGNISQISPNYTRYVLYRESNKFRLHWIKQEDILGSSLNTIYETEKRPFMTCISKIAFIRASDWRLYYLRIWDGDTIALDLQPVRIGNKPYLMNIVTQELHDIDNCTAGPDKTA